MIKILSLLAVAALASSAMAQTTVTWDGNGDGSTYTDGANWGGTAPTDDLTTDVAQLTGGTVNLDADRSVNGLDVDTTSTLTGSGTRLTLGGTGITGSSDLTLDGTVTLRTGTATTYAGNVTIDGATVESTTGDQGFLGTGTIYLDNGGAIIGYGSHVNMRDTTSIVLGSGGGTLANAHTRAFFGLENALISGTGQLTLDGLGSTSYPGNSRIQMQSAQLNTYSGGTLIKNKANVMVNADRNFGAVTGKVTIDDARMVTDANVSFDANREFEIASGGGRISLNQKSSSINGALSGSGALTIDGQSRDDDAGTVGGTLNLNADSTATFTGDINIDAVTVKVARNSIALDSGSANINLSNGGEIAANGDHLDLTGRNIVVDSTGGTLRHSHARNIYGLSGGVISGDGELTMAGSAGGSDAGRIQLQGANTYTGGTRIIDNAQAWAYSDASFGAAGTTITFDSVDGGDYYAANSVDLGTRAIVLNGGGAEFKSNGKTTTIGGVISGAGAMTINGGGALNIESTGTGSGDISIDNVNIQMSANNAFGSGNITLDNGAQLKNNGNGTTPELDNAVIIGSGGGELMAGWNQSLTLNGALSGSGDLTVVADSGIVYLNGDSSGFTGLLSVDSGAKLGGSGTIPSLTVTAGGQLAFSTTDTLTVAGTVALDSTFGIDDLIGIDSSTADGTYTLIENGGDFSHIENFGAGNAYDLGDGKSAYFQNGSLQVTVIPEPATLSIIVAAGAGMLFIRRRLMM